MMELHIRVGNPVAVGEEGGEKPLPIVAATQVDE